MPNHVIFSIEILIHFRCPTCQKWWSIGDPSPQPTIHCPHCGEVLDSSTVQNTTAPIKALLSGQN